MLVWNLDMYDKEKIKKKKKVYKSKQASINALSNFLLLMFFLCFTSNCVGECFSFLAQLHNNSIYSRSHRWAPYRLCFINIEIEPGSFLRCVLKPKLDSSCCKYWWLFLQICLHVFLLYIYIYIYIAFHIQLVGLDMFRERRGKFWIKKSFKKREQRRCCIVTNPTIIPASFFSVETKKSGLVWVFRFDHSPFLYVLLVFSILFIYFIFHV